LQFVGGGQVGQAIGEIILNWAGVDAGVVSLETAAAKGL